MATARLEQRIDALDEDRLQAALAGPMGGDDAHDRAESTAQPPPDHLRAPPALPEPALPEPAFPELFTLWADDSPPRRQECPMARSTGSTTSTALSQACRGPGGSASCRRTAER